MGYSWILASSGEKVQDEIIDEIQSNLNSLYEDDLLLSQYDWSFDVDEEDFIDDGHMSEIRDAVEYADEMNICRTHNSNHNDNDYSTHYDDRNSDYNISDLSGHDASYNLTDNSVHDDNYYNSNDDNYYNDHDSDHNLHRDSQHDSGRLTTHNVSVDIGLCSDVDTALLTNERSDYDWSVDNLHYSSDESSYGVECSSHYSTHNDRQRSTVYNFENAAFYHDDDTLYMKNKESDVYTYHLRGNLTDHHRSYNTTNYEGD